MRLSTKVVRSRSRGPLYSVEYLDLSCLGIVTIDGLKRCSRLQVLLLQGNHIEIVQNLETCYSLWKLDLSNCKLSNLDGLSKFIALGTLNLANNNLAWAELMKIRHMHILDLSLHGNNNMEKDKYYRIHVIDSLPNVWMLDGRIVTSAERIQVEHFFQDSALSERPVRHKLTREQFVPSSMKKLQVSGIYGERTTHFMMRFPTKGALNVETDNRRLRYLSYCLQFDLLLEVQHRKRNQRLTLYESNYLESLLGARPIERDRCNVLLLLLIASLEFSLPTNLVQETLSAAKLMEIGGVDTIELFLMPRDHRCQIASLLLSAVKVDRDDRKDGGLYDRLYLCLYHTVTDLYRRMHADIDPSSPQPSPRINEESREFKSLLAAEVVQLFCIVPVFFDYVTKESGVMRLVSLATADVTVVDKVAELIERITRQGGDLRRIIEEVAEFIINGLNKNTKIVLNKRIPVKSSSSYVLSTPKALPRRPQSSPVHASSYLAVGRPSPERPLTSRTRPSTAQSLSVTGRQQRLPRLGDKMLLAPQNLGFIIALPECDIALVQLDCIPDLILNLKAQAPNGSVVKSTSDVDKNYCYIDMNQVRWDGQYQYWKPVGTTGDRITIQNIEEKLPSNPPTSPTTGNTPPYSPREDPHLPPSPAGEIDDLPRSVSVLLRESLRISPQIHILDSNESASPLTTNRSPPTTNRSPPTTKRSPRQEETNEITELTKSSDEAVLYDCVKCAMEVVRLNNDFMSPRDGDDEGRLEEDAEEERISEESGDYEEENEAREERPASARSLRGLTERAVDDRLLDEITDANTQTPPGTRRNTQNPTGTRRISQRSSTEKIVCEQPDESRQLPARPKTASGPSRATSAKSTASNTSVTSTRSRTIEVDLRPDSEMFSDYQMDRTEEWKRTSKRPQSSRSLGGSSRSSTPTRGRYHEPSGSPVLVQTANDWLAGGMNVHHIEKLTNRMKIHHTPGWMEGVSGRRPQSVGPNRTRSLQKTGNRRNIKSAGMSRDYSGMYTEPLLLTPSGDPPIFFGDPSRLKNPMYETRRGRQVHMRTARVIWDVT
ncbi:uncharacterized protein [Asterias amurensis]|uniref:uncharacterized protein isoform X4 n=1 Tax=Asterias amurensis TaxID=7602 RepID=UPI003AB8EC81